MMLTIAYYLIGAAAGVLAVAGVRGGLWFGLWKLHNRLIAARMRRHCVRNSEQRFPVGLSSDFD